MYKFGATFSRRTLAEVKADVERAARIDNLLYEMDVYNPSSSASLQSQKLENIIQRINHLRYEQDSRGKQMQTGTEPINTGYSDNEGDTGIAWFLPWFRDDPVIEDSINHVRAWRLSGTETCFLGDANSLVLSASFLSDTIAFIRERFPSLGRFTIYGRTKSAAKKSIHELNRFREAGIDRIHFGMESGSDTVLAFMEKGVTAREHIEGCQKTRDAGISPSVYIMPGLGGRRWSVEHARETARVLTEGRPDFVRIRSLEIFPGTELSQQMSAGQFEEATEDEVVREIRTIVDETACETAIISDSASNLLNITGTLPSDRSRMLAVIDDFLERSPRERLEYSLISRLRSFFGQYGGITPDIERSLGRSLRKGAFDISLMSEGEMSTAIRVIRSKLMP